MKHLSLFTGAGGGEYAAFLLGLVTVAYVEANKHCQSVIQQRQEDGIFCKGPVFGDVRAFDGTQWAGLVDVISAGFPCQPFSVAGKGLAADDERNMWPDTLRIIREVEPIFVYLENSPGLLDSRGARYAATVLGELSELGFDAAWEVVPGSALGAPHERKRWWCLAAHPERFKLRYEQEQKRRSDGKTVAPDYGSVREVAPDTDRQRQLQQTQRRDEQGPRPGRGPEATSDTDSAGRQEQWFRLAKEAEEPAAQCGDWWAALPDVVCMVHGLANRSERIKSLGNGQIPAVAAFTFMALLERILSAWGVSQH